MGKICLVFMLLITQVICKAQDSVKRKMPLVKESPKIDSLIFSLINIPESRRSQKNDSCILLSLSSVELDNFVYGLHATTHRNTIFDLGGNLKRNRRLGYFYFNGYLIFVLGDNFINKFIRYTDFQKEFIFRNPNVKENSSLITDYMSWAVFYRDGNLNYGVH